MKLLRVVVFLVLLVGVLSSVSNINLSPAGVYPQISTKGGLGVSIAILIYMLFSELGYLPFKFTGRRRRSAVGQLTTPLMLGDRDNILKLILSMDRQSCLLRFLCELEGSRKEAEKNNLRLDPDLEEDLILLKVAKRQMHPAELMRQDPGSPALPFEIAVFTGSEGLNTCASVFQTCPYNITTMQGFLGEDLNHL
ncbi:hypothetical protein DAPPUDRAFT_306352 [Daphnia pulex]|uniref:Uncharacterized protein n=1 Tax=Daphnia pulex TaxID=6669 RepID=E9FY46_DAPPU|nr:hypothetical protein DAPPUDRAFT_306352 [Daphnia pulex]|eukprot:EFX87473.1 hypothetical protein DAPPUDRAFT_306352 [Daphnia pulex]